MTEQQIKEDGFTNPENLEKIPLISYPKEIYHWIIATSDMYGVHGNKYYKVNGIWQSITVKLEVNDY